MKQMYKLKVFSFHTEIFLQTICLSFIIPACVHMEITGKDFKKYTLWFVNASCQLWACLFVPNLSMPVQQLSPARFGFEN